MLFKNGILWIKRIFLKIYLPIKQTLLHNLKPLSKSHPRYDKPKESKLKTNPRDVKK